MISIQLLLQRITDPHGVWPWAEHNQGTLTFSALILAFGIALYELRRAARSEDRDTCSFVDFVLQSADRGIDLTRDAIMTCDGVLTGHDQMTIDLWEFLQDNAMATLQEVLPIRPNVPELVFLINGLDRMLSVRRDHEIFKSGERAALFSILQMLEIQREKIARLRPPTDREKILRRLHLSKHTGRIQTPLSDALKRSIY